MHASKLMLETLEPRQLLSATPLGFEPLFPQTSLVQVTPTFGNTFSSTAQTDQYEVEVEAGDLLSIVVTPNASTLQIGLDVRAPDGSVTAAPSVSAGEKIVFEAFAAETGTYGIDISNSSGTGFYYFEVALNAVVELENVGGPDNNTIGSAQALDGAVLDLPGELGGSRFAVRGQLGGSDADHYKLDLTAGQTLSVAVEGLSQGLAQVELLDAGGNLLAMGSRDAEGIDARVNGYEVTADGTYYLRVSSISNEPYTLFGTIDAQIGYEFDTFYAFPQTITPGTPMVGHLGDGAGPSGNPFFESLYGEPNDTFYDAAYIDFYESELWQLDGEIGDNFNLSDQAYDVDIIELGYLESGTHLTADIDAATQGSTLDSYLRLFDSSGFEVAFSDDDAAPGEAGSSDSYIDYVVEYDDTYYLGISSFGNNDYDLESEESGGQSGFTQGFYQLTVGINGAGGGSDVDDLAFAVNADDVLTATVASAGENLYLQIEIIDENGSVVASDSATGSSDAQATYTVPTGTGPDAQYFLRITSQVDAVGAYVVKVDGATGATDASAGPILLTNRFPNALPDYVSYPDLAFVSFNTNLDPASIDVTDLTVTGPGGASFNPTAITYQDGGNLTFDVFSANAPTGQYTFSIADGALTDLNGNSVTGTTRTINYRQEGPRVTASSLVEGAVLSPGGLTNTVEFSEPLLDFVSSGFFGFIVLNAEDVEITNMLTGQVRNPINFSYTTSPTPTVETVFSQLDEGVYQIRYLASKPGGFEVHFQSADDGLPLDGSPSGTLPSGDGRLGDDFIINFTVDRPDNTPLPTLTPVGPVGGQVYTHEPVLAAISDASDVDTFTVNVDQAQTLALALEALDPSLQLRVRVLDPGGAQLLDTNASAAGKSILVQPQALPVSGEYVIEVTSLSGVGGYNLQSTLNAAIQVSGNETLNDAQAIDGSAISLGDDGERLAVMGQIAGVAVSETQSITGTAFAPNLLTYQFAAGDDPVGGVTLTFDADNVSAFGTSRSMAVTLEGLSQQDIYVYFTSAGIATIDLSAQQWRTLTADGQATIRVKPSADVTGSASSSLTVTVSYATADTADYYSINLAEGQALDLAARSWPIAQPDPDEDDDGGGAASASASSVNPAAGRSGVAFQLLDSSGQVLAASSDQLSYGTAGLTGFVASQAGDYIVRVVGDGNYALVATRDAMFNLEQSDDRPLSPGVALGALAKSGIEGRTIRIAHLDSPAIGGSGNDANRLINQLNDTTEFNFNAVRVEAFELATIDDLNAFDVIVTGGVSQLRSTEGLGQLLREYVEAGGGLVIVGDAPSRTGASTSFPAAADFDAVSPIYLSSPRVDAPNSIDMIESVQHPVTAGLDDFAPNYSTVGTIRGAIGKPGAVVLARSGDVDTVVIRELGEGGRSAYLGSVYDADYFTSSPIRSGAPDQLLEQAVAWAAGSGDTSDRYTVELNEGQTLTVVTGTPADGQGLPDNQLNPALQLIDPNGNIVAGDADGLDGKNASLTYTVPQAGAGTYTIVIVAENFEGGSYVLISNTMAAGDATGPSVTNAALSGGRRLANPPTQLTLTFDEAIDLTSLDPAGLTLTNGGTVTGVEFLDGQTIRFLLDIPDAAGTFSYTLTQDALTDLAGNGNAAYTDSFMIDRTGPQVIAQTPGTQAAAPFNRVTLTFNEAIDPDSISIEDIVAFTAPDGSDLTDQISSVFGSGDQFVVIFDDQLALGTYTLTIGPQITDTVGQLMDQNGNGIGGEAGDTYTASLSIQSPNLTVESVVPNAPAVFGQPLELTYTVRNIGTDAAVEGWTDRVYLSTDGTLDFSDRSLLIYDASSNAPLAPGQAYTNTVTVNLPLIASLDEGDYQVLVFTDSGHNQPEDSELDNVGSSGVIPVALPDLPDLIISNITLPDTPQETGQPIEISWTVTNQGDGAADGVLFDDIYLSEDETLNYLSDRYLGRFARQGLIAPGESVVRTQLVNLPLELDGDRFIIIRTDGANRFYEHKNEDNNVRVSDEPLDLVFPPLPDLTVGEITAPATALSNEIITVTWTIRNDGPADFVGTFTDKVFISPDALAGGDQELGRFVFDGEIAAGGSVTRSANVQLPPDLSGDRFIVIQTDALNNVFEDSGETNNTGVDDTPIDVTQSPFPNLQVTLITAPQTVFSGQSTEVTWRVTNTGDAPTSAANWTDAVYLSTDGQLGGLDRFLGDIQTPAFLNPGEAYEQTLTVKIPDGTQGPYYFLVLTDNRNRVFELDNENDNVGVSQLINVQLTPPPDLQVTSVDAPPAAFSGQPMNLRWTVTNEGAGGTVAESWHDRVWFSLDENLDNLDILLGEFKHTGALDAGGSYTAEHSVVLPTGQTGPFYFIVEADRRNEVFEFAFEGNNLGTDPSPTDVLLTPPPDLSVNALTAPTRVEAGRNLTVSYRVDNDGATPTPNSTWNDRIYLSLDDVFDPNEDIVLGNFFHRGALAPGEGYDVEASFRVPDGLSGSYTLFVVTDQGNAVFELDNNNNIASPDEPVEVVLTPPDLVLTDVTTPAIAAAGAATPISYTVENQGIGATTVTRWFDRIYLSSDGTLDNAQVINSHTHDGALDVGESYTVDLNNLVIPLATTPGDYFLIFETDYAQSAYESDDTNNTTLRPISVVRDTADLQVTSLTPVANAFSGQNINIEWTITNNGTATTNTTTWFDRVYLSADPALGGSTDILIGQFQRTNPLDAGASYTRINSILIPDGLIGDYYIIVHTDFNNRVFEAGEDSNNIFVAPDTTSITLAPAPDLTVSGVQSPTSGFSGRNISVTYTTQNDGNAPVNRAVYESIYLSADRLVDSGDRLLSSTLEPLSLTPGESREITRTVKLPSGVTGNFYILVRTDASDRVFEQEQGELNNVGFNDTPINIELAPPVDLVAGTITVPVSGVAGELATISYTVNNDGPNPALGPWTDTLFLSTDQTWDINDRRFAEVLREQTVQAGESYTATATAPLPGVLPGDYYLIVRTDILNQVIETDETNNVSASLDAFALNIPALELDTPTTVTLQQGRFNYFAVDLEADKTFVLDIDAGDNEVVVELFARLEDVPARDRFDFNVQSPLTANSRLVVPDTDSGRYYIAVYGTAVPGGPVSVDVTARVVPFSILDTDYGVAGTAGTRTLQINGARFDRTITARLLGDGVNRVADAMFPVNEARAYATLDFTGLTPGLYDIQITKADGSTDTLQDAIQVVAGGGGTNDPRLLGPNAVTASTQQFPIAAVWGNDGINDAIAPLLYVEASNLIGDTGSDRSASMMLFYGAGLDDGPAGILRPDQASSRALASGFAGAGPGSTTTIIDKLVEDQSQTYDWEQWREQLPRLGMDEATYNAAFDQMIDRNGTTWADYLAMLSRNANLLPEEIGDNRSPRMLTLLELRFAAADLGNGIVGRINAPDFDVDISGIKVTASDDNTGAGYTAISLNDGTFIFFDIDPGTYTFAVEGGRVIDVPQVQAIVTDNASAFGVVIETDGGISATKARILDAETGTGLANVYVHLMDESGKTVFSTLTDASGFYDLSLAKDGTYTLRVQPNDYVRTLIDEFVIEDGVELPDITVGRGAAATGTINFNGAPVGSETFILAAPDLSDPTQDVFDFTTSNTFVLNGLQEGVYTFWVFSGDVGERIDNVVIGDGGLVDLGTINFTASASQPDDILSPVALASSSALVNEGWSSVIKFEDSYRNTGAELYTPDAETLSAMNRIRFSLQLDWITAATAKWGRQNAQVWQDFILTSPESPSARQRFGESSQIVNGSTFAAGFRDQPSLIQSLDIAETFAGVFFRTEFQNGTYSMSSLLSTGPRYIQFENITPSFNATNGDSGIRLYNYDSVLDIPGNLAGGAGSIGQGTGNGGGLGQVYTDIREVDGFATLSPVNSRTARVDYFVYFMAADLVDFQPGNPGTGYEQWATKRLWALEVYGEAFDIPFVAEYDLGWESILITKNPGNPQSPDGPPSFTLNTARVPSRDPNDILGPDGFGPEKFIPANQAINYTIRFENDAELAQAPAQEIFINAPLDDNLDPRTFRLGDIQISQTLIDVPDDRAFFQTRLDLTETEGIFLDVFAGVNLETNEAFWRFISIDPATGEIPLDPFLGLLPINDENGLGEGFAQYSIRPNADAQTGDVIDAAATIIFDVNGPIETPPIFNTLDAGKPTSSVHALPASSSSESFNVTWGGLDEANGSGIAGYDIFVSIDGGPFERWLAATTQTAAIYTGDVGKSYAFYSVAIDNVGNREDAPAAPDAMTAIAAGPSVTGYQVNDGSAQRSVVQSLTVFFDQPVNLGALAFELNRRDNGQSVGFTVTLSADRRSAVLQFAGHSLADGVYDLTVNQTGITNDSGASLTTGGSFSFLRLFGDFDGDGDADGLDLRLFRAVLGAVQGDSRYNAMFDFNGDGVIDLSDYNQARLRSRTKLQI